MRVNTLHRKIEAVGDTFEELVKDAETFWDEKHEGWIMVSMRNTEIGAGYTKKYAGTFEITYRRDIP